MVTVTSRERLDLAQGPHLIAVGLGLSCLAQAGSQPAKLPSPPPPSPILATKGFVAASESHQDSGKVG